MKQKAVQGSRMKFVAPILQGVMIIMVCAALGGSYVVYADYRLLPSRVAELEKSVSSLERSFTLLNDQIGNVPLCRPK